jgi:hypothetical protein
MILVFKGFRDLSLRSFLYTLAQKPSKGQHKSKSGQSNGIKERKPGIIYYTRMKLHNALKFPINYELFIKRH